MISFITFIEQQAGRGATRCIPTLLLEAIAAWRPAMPSTNSSTLNYPHREGYDDGRRDRHANSRHSYPDVWRGLGYASYRVTLESGLVPTSALVLYELHGR